MEPEAIKSAPRKPRPPKQARSKQRYESLLDAAHNLMMARGSTGLSIYDIATAADTPPASVYHFFPSVDAVHLALAERYWKHFDAVFADQAVKTGARNWQDMLHFVSSHSIAYYRENPPCMELFLGKATSWELREYNHEGNRRAAAAFVATLYSSFLLPDIPELADKVHLAIEIIDNLCGMSYALHGRITEEIEAEGLRAAIAYLRLYLPEYISLK